MAKRAQQDSGEGRVTAKSRPMMNLTARTPSFVSSSPSANPGRSSYGYEEDQTIYKIMVHPGLLKCGSGDGEHDRPGQPDKNSWVSLGKADSHRGEHLLGRTAHSARNEETIPDGTVRPASENVQGKADFEKLIVGSDITEFVNKVMNQVRIRQKRMSSKCRGLYRTFDNMGNVDGYDIECSHIHGKELFHDAECCAE